MLGRSGLVNFIAKIKVVMMRYIRKHGSIFPFWKNPFRTELQQRKLEHSTTSFQIYLFHLIRFLLYYSAPNLPSIASTAIPDSNIPDSHNRYNTPSSWEVAMPSWESLQSSPA